VKISVVKRIIKTAVPAEIKYEITPSDAVL